jgi:hypothetical protein
MNIDFPVNFHYLANSPHSIDSLHLTNKPVCIEPPNPNYSLYFPPTDSPLPTEFPPQFSHPIELSIYSPSYLDIPVDGPAPNDPVDGPVPFDPLHVWST